MAKKKAARSARPAARTRKTTARKASASARPKGRATAKKKGAGRAAKQPKRAGTSAARTSGRKATATKKSSAAARKKTSASSRSRSAKSQTRQPGSAAIGRTGKGTTAAGRKTPMGTTRQAPSIAKAAPKLAGPRKTSLDRARRTVEDVHGVPSSLDLARPASAVRTGRAELEQKLHDHTSTSPALTAGDVDADWGSAEAVGDEAPGGDNPTPDQDVVEEIGRALGVEYDDDQELQGGEEIAERDRHRWELDPGSSDDFEER